MQELVLTLDVDWAPDFMLDFVIDVLAVRMIKSTWFMTHPSPAIERLRRLPELFELGIHPNFRPGSSHGATPEEILKHCLGLVPEAESMRTHSLVQSSTMLDAVLRLTPIKVDVTHFLPRHPNLRPFEFRSRGRGLWRVPFNWQDDYELYEGAPCWDLQSILRWGPGLTVLNFHPCLIYMNANDPARFDEFRRSIGHLPELKAQEADRFSTGGPGPRTLFLEVLDYLAAGGSGRLIRDVVADAGRRTS